MFQPPVRCSKCSKPRFHVNHAVSRPSLHRFPGSLYPGDALSSHNPMIDLGEGSLNAQSPMFSPALMPFPPPMPESLSRPSCARSAPSLTPPGPQRRPSPDVAVTSNVSNSAEIQMLASRHYPQKLSGAILWSLGKTLSHDRSQKMLRGPTYPERCQKLSKVASP